MDRRQVLLGMALALTAPHVRTQSAEARIALGPPAEPSGPIDAGAHVKGYRADSIRGHSINAYWVHDRQRAFAVDAYWRIPEAQEAMGAFPRITGLATEAVGCVLITHPHTDHYGGLETVQAAAGGAPAVTSNTISRVIRNDEHGFYANRLLDMPGQIPPVTPVASNGLQQKVAMPIAGQRVEVVLLRDNEAVETALLYLPQERALIAGDFVNGKTTPVLYQGGIDNWIRQLKTVRDMFPQAKTIAPGHGAVGAFDAMVDEQVAYLTTFRDLVEGELDRSDGQMTADGVKRITNGIVDAFPDWRTSAGVPDRSRLIALNIDWTLRGWRFAGAETGGPAAFRPDGD